MCGVKGTLRSGRSINALSVVPYARAKYGVQREARQYINELNRAAMNVTRERSSALSSVLSSASMMMAHKSTERLILGSDIIPIQINNDKLGDLIQNEIFSSNQLRSYSDHHKTMVEMNSKVSAIGNKLPSTSISLMSVMPTSSNVSLDNVMYRNVTMRQARVVGGEDGDNGEWCWQVALINSMNQYLCGAALIGTQWVLTAAHCVTK